MPEIQITYTYISAYIQRSSLNNLLQQLPTKLHADILRYKFEKDQYARAIGKYLLLKQLEEFGYQAEILKRLEKGTYEKPILAGIPISFNIAHSGDLVVCAASSECKLGIDAEQIKKTDIAIFQDQFTRLEWQAIQVDDSLQAFYHYWTRKESVIKADGRGLQIPLQSFDTTQAMVQLPDTPTQWYLQPLELDPTYKTHLCTDTNTKQVLIRKLLPDH
ncbi:hypothetical protein BKI52_22640 [marine bacterium AO1-C]|nr:hypothetical protein BKI52_22640 [marine bacterium AO1-C]